MQARFAPAGGAHPHAADDLARTRAVAERLCAEAGRGGLLRFDRWMQLVLYDPEVGYYARPGRALGRAGDFYTAAHVSPLFAQALGMRLKREWERLGEPDRFVVLELGPGDGTLAADLLPSLADTLGDETRIEYRYVEASDSLARRVREGIAPLGASGRVGSRRLSSPGAAGSFRGVTIANEFFDALPVRRLVRRGAAWAELWVRVDRDPMEWAERPLDEAPPSPPLPLVRDGTVFEVAPGLPAALRAVGDSLVAGAWIALDFGAEEGDLGAHGLAGTLAAHRGHRLVDPLSAPGLADLSAWVDLTRLRAQARAAGWVELAVRPQAQALADWGLPALAERAAGVARGTAESVRVRLAAKNLLFGFSTFWALEWRAGSTGEAPSAR